MSFRRRMMMAANTISAKSYVQDGLVALFDGIENAGYGIHNGNATNWVNLVTGVAGNTFPQTAQVGDSYIQTTTNNVSLIRSGFKAVLQNASELTIETVMQEVVKSSNNNAALGVRLPLGFTVFCFRHDSSFYGPMVYQDSGGRYGYFRYYNINNTYPKASRSIIISNIGGSSRVYHGYDNLIDVSNTNYLYTYSETPYDRDSLSIGGSISGTFRTFCIRVYNRALTDAERIQNYNIDKVRFEL